MFLSHHFPSEMKVLTLRDTRFLSRYKIPVSDISFGNPDDPEYAIFRISIPQIAKATEETVRQGLWKLGIDKTSVEDTRLAVTFTIAVNGEIIRFPSCISRGVQAIVKSNWQLIFTKLQTAKNGGSKLMGKSYQRTNVSFHSWLTNRAQYLTLSVEVFMFQCVRSVHI